MIYPCTDCLVDVMCIDACDKFISFMVKFDSHPTWYHEQHLGQMTATDSRFKRARKCAIINLHSLTLHDKLERPRIRNLISQREEYIRND